MKGTTYKNEAIQGKKHVSKNDLFLYPFTSWQAETWPLGTKQVFMELLNIYGQRIDICKCKDKHKR